VKRWCKRPPASPETGAARQAPPGATPIGAMTRPAELQVGGNEPAGDGRPRWMAAPDRIPLIDRLTESPALQGFPTPGSTGGHHRGITTTAPMTISGLQAAVRTAWLRGKRSGSRARSKADAYMRGGAMSGSLLAAAPKQYQRETSPAADGEQRKLPWPVVPQDRGLNKQEDQQRESCDGGRREGGWAAHQRE